MCFDLDKKPSDRADRTIKIGPLRGFEVGKERRHPWCQMPVEEIALALHGHGALPGNQSRHDLAEDRRMVFGLASGFDALDAQTSEVGAQPRQRPLMQKAGQVIRPVRQQLAAADADKEIEIFARDRDGIFRRSRCGQRLMRKTERRRVTLDDRQSLEQRLIRRPREERRKERIFLRTRDRSIVSGSGRIASPPSSPPIKRAPTTRASFEQHANTAAMKRVNSPEARIDNYCGSAPP